MLTYTAQADARKRMPATLAARVRCVCLRMLTYADVWGARKRMPATLAERVICGLEGGRVPMEP